jgi:hypothetical protein
MPPHLAADVQGIVAALALTAAAPLGNRLRQRSHRERSGIESVTAGISLAYVTLDLLVELTTSAGKVVHARLPLAPGPEGTLFALVLFGATSSYSVQAVAARVGGTRARYRANLFHQLVYSVCLGGALGLEAEHGVLSLALFDVAMLLHLIVLQCHISHRFAHQHVGLSRALLAVAPFMGAVGWALLGIPDEILFFGLALVAGSTAVQIIQTELPSPEAVRVGPFLLGVAVYAMLVGVRWAT